MAIASSLMAVEAAGCIAQGKYTDLAFLGLSAVNRFALESTGQGLGGAIEQFLNHHVMYHGTADKNVIQIDLMGFKQSGGGMLGKGVYASHDYNKAKWFARNRAKRAGCKAHMCLVEFDSANIKVTHEASRSWRQEGFDAVYSTAAERPEMCINGDKVKITYKPANGSLSEKCRVLIDEFFIKHPTLKKCSVWLGIAGEVLDAARNGAKIGAMTAGHLMNAMAKQSEKMEPASFGKLIEEGVWAGTLAGFGSGMAAALAYGPAIEVALGAASAGAAGCAVAFPVAVLVGALYVIANHAELQS